MIYTDKQKESIVDHVCTEMAKGRAFRTIMLKDKDMPTDKTFHSWIDKSETYLRQYARAASKRADAIFEDILDIADDQEGDVYKDKDGNEQTNHNVIQRARLRVDSRKWMAGKLNPKKYGEAQLLKLGDHEGEEIKLNAIFSTDILKKPDVQTDDSVK